MKDDIVIVSAARTPVGSFNGALASLPGARVGQGGGPGIAQTCWCGAGAMYPKSFWAKSSPPARAKIPLAKRPLRPAFPSKRLPGASISSAARACGRSRSAIRPSSTAIPKSLSPVGRNP